MKRVSRAWVAALVLAAAVPAPLLSAVDFDLGVKAGVTLSNNAWSGDDGTEKSVIRPAFGVFAVIPLTSRLAILPEVGYLSTGESWADPTEVVQSFGYIHIPVLLRFRLLDKGRIVPGVFAGPALGILVKATSSGEDVKEFFRSVDFGADLGAGAEIAVSRFKLVIDVRFYLGLSNAYAGPEASMKNRALTVTAGGLF